MLDDDILVLSEDTPFSDALEAMRPALERALREPAVATEVADAWPSALCRIQVAGLYAEIRGEEMGDRGKSPGEVRARLAHLESLRHVVSRPDGLAKPPGRVFLVTDEGRRWIRV